MKFDDSVLVNEEMELVKFRYPSKNCRNPRVIVIDSQYPGKQNEKHYGETLDVLGVNLKYIPSGERKEAKQALSSIDLFSDFIGAGKKERYERLKDFCPEYLLPYIRRYKKEKMRNVKIRRGMFYHPYSFTEKDPDIGKEE